MIIAKDLAIRQFSGSSGASDNNSTSIKAAMAALFCGN
jgi:hypothetical protein